MTQIATTPAATEAPKLTLFTVMSPWHARDPDEGTFEENVWAVDGADARRKLTESMADSKDSFETDEERDDWVKRHLTACSGLMVTSQAIDTVKSDLRELLSGPESGFNAAAKADYDAIMAILAKRMKV